MQIALLVERDNGETSLEHALAAGNCAYRKIQDTASVLTHAKEIQPEIILFNLDTPTDKLIADLHALGQHCPLPVVIFARKADDDAIAKVINADASALIIDGLPCQRITPIIQIALARFKHTQALKNALEEARTQLEDRKQIDKAKAILIKTQKFTEDEAYHTLRKLAMDRNITLGAMARNVIAMAELLK